MGRCYGFWKSIDLCQCQDSPLPELLENVTEPGKKRPYVGFVCNPMGDGNHHFAGYEQRYLLGKHAGSNSASYDVVPAKL